MNNSYLVSVYTLNIQRPHLISLFKTTKTKTFAVHVTFGVENINHTFFLTLKPLNMLSSTLFVVCLLLNTLFLLFFQVKVVIRSAAAILLHFNLEKHNSYIGFSLLTTVDTFNAYLEVFKC